MADQVQLRGGPTAENAAFTGVAREVTIDTDKKVPVVHDGHTQGGFPLLRQDIANLPPGTINDVHLATSAVIADKLADLAVSTAKIADASVTAAKLADLAVSTAKIADASVTAAKLADASVTAAKLADLAVTTTKLADASVTAAKLAEAVTPAQFDDSTKLATTAFVRRQGIQFSSVAKPPHA